MALADSPRRWLATSVKASSQPIGCHFAADPAQRLAQAVGVVLDVLQGYRLGTDMAAAVLRVALDRSGIRGTPPSSLRVPMATADGSRRDGTHGSGGLVSWLASSLSSPGRQARRVREDQTIGLVVETMRRLPPCQQRQSAESPGIRLVMMGAVEGGVPFVRLSTIHLGSGGGESRC